MKKLVFFNSTMQMGGPARVISLWSNYFVDQNYKIEVVSNIDVPLFYDFDKRVQYSILAIDKFKQKSKLKTLFKMYKFLKNRKDEILVFNKGLYISYLFVLKQIGLLDNSLKFVYFAHGGGSDFKTMYSNLANYMILYTFDHIVALLDDYDAYDKKIEKSVNREWLDKLVPSCWNQIKAKISYIPNPVTFRTKDISSYDEKTVLAVGRLDYIKGFDLLIDAWKYISIQYPKWQLKIVGSGECENDLKNQIKELKLDKFIQMIPQQQDVKSLYLNSSIYVMSSRQEGYGMVVVEAMECGLPIVAFKNVGANFLVKDIQNGFLCEIGDTKQLSLNIEKLIIDKKLRAKMGKKSKDLVQQFYIKNIASKWDEILK